MCAFLFSLLKKRTTKQKMADTRRVHRSKQKSSADYQDYVSGSSKSSSSQLFSKSSKSSSNTTGSVQRPVSNKREVILSRARSRSGSPLHFSSARTPRSATPPRSWTRSRTRSTSSNYKQSVEHVKSAKNKSSKSKSK